jgi:protein SERAC1
VQAVVRAHEQNQHYSDILDSIQGVAFFGTPHQGSDLAFWDHIGTSIVWAVALGYSTNTTLAKDLKIDSVMLKSISESFAYRGAKMRIRSFYETESMRGLNCRVGEAIPLRTLTK